MSRHYLYRHIRLDSQEPFYIGIGTKPDYNVRSHERQYHRAYVKAKKSTFWKNITSKTDYEVEILMESDDYDFIKQKEIEFIALYGRRDLGLGTLVNMTDGGDGVSNKVLSKETRDKMSKSAMGKKASDETKAKLSLASKGRMHTEETILKFKEISLKGEDNPSSKLILNTQTGVYYPSIREAAKSFNVSAERLGGMLSGALINNSYFIIIDINSNSIVPIIPPSNRRKEYETKKGDTINWKCKQVIDVVSGIVYDCAKNVAIDFGYTSDYFKKMLSPTNNKYRNTTNFEYYDKNKHFNIIKNTE